jgi:PEGA domain
VPAPPAAADIGQRTGDPRNSTHRAPAAAAAISERSLHVLAPAKSDAPSRIRPAPTTPPPPPPRLFPPRRPEAPPLPPHLAHAGGVAKRGPQASVAVAPSPRVTRTRTLVGAVVLLVVLQSGFLAWWMRSNPRSAVVGSSSVTITSEPSGSAVVLDGSTMGATPLTTTIPAGTHQLQVGNEAPQTITVEAGANASMHVVLARAEKAAAAARVGSVEITTTPPGAEITVDGVRRGISPVKVPGLTPGPHAVTLARGGRLLRRTVTVAAGASVPLAVAMEGTGTGPGWLTVTSPVPALIYAGDTLVGRTDTPRMQLAAGRHTLVLVNDALQFREERIVDVAPGRTVSIQLETIYGTLNINAQPWATVSVDGTVIGETPIGNYSLPIGSHEVVLRHPELGERRQTVVVGVGSPARVGLDLRR